MMKKLGISKQRGKNGTRLFRVRFSIEGVVHNVGCYFTEKEAMKGHDMYVIKNNIDRETFLLKKIQ